MLELTKIINNARYKLADKWNLNSRIDLNYIHPGQIADILKLLEGCDMRGLGLTAQGVDTEMSAMDVIMQLRNLSSMDETYDTGKIFNTECASPHPFALFADIMFAERNAVKEQHPSLTIMEDGVIGWLARLQNHPNAQHYESRNLTVDKDVANGEIGYLPSGGTAANIVAFWALRNYDMKQGRNRTKILVPKDAHYSDLKLENLLGLQTVKVNASENFEVDLDHMASLMDEDVLAIFATAGTSRLGVVQPIKEIAQIASRFDAYVHVDAAFGGYVLPFMERLGYEIQPWDFRVEGVASITSDPHKMGLCPLGVGAIIFRDHDFINSYRTNVDFPKITNFTLEGSRPGGPIAAAYAMTMYFGEVGYTQTVKRVIDQRDLFISEVASGQIKLVRKPDINAVGITTGNAEDNIELLHYLKSKGYQISGLRDDRGLRFIFHADHKDSHILELTKHIKNFESNL